MLKSMGAGVRWVEEDSKWAFIPKVPSEPPFHNTYLGQMVAMNIQGPFPKKKKKS